MCSPLALQTVVIRRLNVGNFSHCSLKFFFTRSLGSFFQVILRARGIHCVAYGKADGLPSIECQGGFQPSGLKSRDGRLWFPTIKGLAIVNPNRVARNPAAPIVLTEDLVVDGIAQPAAAETATAEAAMRPARSTLKIQPGKRNLEFHYTATSLTAPEKVRFRYRLEGLEKDWTDADARRAVTYSRLPPGNFEFHVIACNNDGVWNEQGAVLAVTMLPFFWQTGWFVSVSGLVLIAAIFAAVRLVATRRLQLKLERLQREQVVERERARIAKDIHDDLGASLTEITILSELAQNPDTPAPKAQADIRTIATKSRTLTQLLDEIVWAVNPQRDTLENFVTYACNYAEDYLRVAQIQCRLNLPPVVPEVSLHTHIRHGLFLAFKEALNNVVKHAAATEVNLGMELRGDAFIVSIQDNGKGFDTGPRAGVGPGEPRRNDIGGEGLSNMRQRVEGLGGRFDLQSRPGLGTQVRLEVPVSK